MTDETDEWTPADRSAAEACLAVITQYFIDGKIAVEYLREEDPAKVVSFLLGQLIATITDLGTLAEIDPSKYVNSRAMKLALDT